MIKKLFSHCLSKPFFRSNQASCAVLLYHRIFKPKIDTQLLSVSPENFERHLVYLKQNFDVISLRTLAKRLRSNNLKGRSVCITFDDGYFDNFLNAFPLLTRHKIPATIFVSTSNLGLEDEFWWDELENIFFYGNDLYLKWNALSSERDDTVNKYLEFQSNFKNMHIDQRIALLGQLKKTDYKPRKNYRSMNCKELAELNGSEFVELGIHTENHYSLGQVSQKTAIDEIEASARTIRKSTGEKELFFSYPFGGEGDCREDLDQVFTANGISTVCLNQNGLCRRGTPLRSIPRVLVRNLAESEFSNFIQNLWN